MNKGFTLIELVIVIVIVAVLSVVAVPIYRGYTEKAKITEAKSLTGTLQNAQKIYYAEFGNWYEISDWVAYDEVLKVDARPSKYFKNIRTKRSSLRPKTIEAGAMSRSEDRSVFQYWPENPNTAGSNNSRSIPRWDTYTADESKLLSTEH